MHPAVAMEAPFDGPDVPQGKIWTYGGDLLLEDVPSNTLVDLRLRTIVALCMSHNPVNRPRLDHLQKIIRTNLMRDFNETDEETLRWATEFFKHPAPPQY